MKVIDGNRFGSSRALSSRVVPLSTTISSYRMPRVCSCIDASAAAVVSHAFQFTRMTERSGRMRRIIREVHELGRSSWYRPCSERHRVSADVTSEKEEAANGERPRSESERGGNPGHER